MLKPKPNKILTSKPLPAPAPAIVPVHDPETRQVLEDMHVKTHTHHEQAHLDAEHHLQQMKRNGDSLESIDEGNGRIMDGLKDSHQTIKDNGHNIDDLHEGLSDKLDEVIDAIKSLDKTEVDGAPEEDDDDTELTEVVDLLKDIIEEMKQPCTITLELE